MGLKVAYVTPYFHPATVYGGPAMSMLGIARALARQGCEVRVLTTDANGTGRLRDVPNGEHELEPGIRIRYCRRDYKQATSLELLRLLPEHVRWGDVLHVGGVYNFPTIPALAVARVARRPVVLSTQGMLQRWERASSVRLKYVYEQVCTLVAPRRFALHVTSQSEEAQSRRRLPRAITAFIPHSVHVPESLPPRIPGEGALRLTALGRLHPIKGLENLLEACALLDPLTVPWSLTLAGDGDATYRARLGAMVLDLGLSERVSFVGHVGGPAKTELLSRTDVLVAPSFTENFGLSIAEALAHAVPVIAGRGTPWEGLELHRAGLWVENDPASLAEAIRRAASLPLEEMGVAGRAWIQRDFTLERQGDALVKLYRRLEGS